ncbi:MerR family transcriptional regulator [Persephonella sp.]
MLTKETAKKSQEERSIEYGYFLLNWKYGSIKKVADLVGVSERMIRFYIEHYWVFKVYPKFQRKKGAYGRFLGLITGAKRSFEKKIEKLSKERNVDPEEVLDIFKETIKQ